MKLQKSGNGFWLSIPKEMVESEGWQKGDIFYTAPLVNGIAFIKGREKRD